MSFITSFKNIVRLPRFHWFNQSFLRIVRRARIPTGFGELCFGRFLVALGTMLVHGNLSLPPPHATPQEITLFQGVNTLPETNSSHLKWMVGIRGCFLLGRLGLFFGALAVSFRECNYHCPLTIPSSLAGRSPDLFT